MTYQNNDLNNAELINAIDSWIELGKTYDEAYELATENGSANDYEASELAVQFGIKTQAQAEASQEVDIAQLTKQLAMQRGYCESEAEQITNHILKAVAKSRATKDNSYYIKAYNLFIKRLVA